MYTKRLSVLSRVSNPGGKKPGQAAPPGVKEQAKYELLFPRRHGMLPETPPQTRPANNSSPVVVLAAELNNSFRSLPPTLFFFFFIFSSFFFKTVEIGADH